MKTIILCGGLGTRMKEETEFKPKPLVLIGGKPILWHIMKIYAYYGYNEFVLALGYRENMIKDYFLRMKAFLKDFTLDTLNQKISFHDEGDDFKITFVDTGLESQTGERILRVKRYITEDNFMVTYGDGVSYINIKNLVNFHKQQKTIGTITGVHPYSKYGVVKINQENNLVVNFKQKPLTYDYVSGGFMVFKKEAFDYFDNEEMENGLIKIANQNQLSIFKHDGFWKAMDTYREVKEMNELWKSTEPWSVWKKNNK